MTRLIAVSLIWAFSFVLIKGRLAGLDAAFVALVRMALSLLIFLPFYRPRALGGRNPWRAVAIGVVQFGLMYVLYIQAYQYLAAWQIAFFTLSTPLWVSLLARESHTWNRHAAALVAVLAAAFLLPLRGDAGRASWLGFALLQGANLSFAWGQLAWREWMRSVPSLEPDKPVARIASEEPTSPTEKLSSVTEEPSSPAQAEDHELMALPFAGALLVPALAFIFGFTEGSHRPDGSQLMVLAYLGIVSSGVGFYLWNSGARMVGTAKLAVLNNLKIPLGVLASLILLGEKVDLLMLFMSILMMLVAFWFAGRAQREVVQK